jgi:hypothetical protein
MEFSVVVPYWREFEARIDRNADSAERLAKKATRTSYERFTFISSLWLPSVQESLLDGAFALATVKLRGFALFVRVHRKYKPGVAEAFIDQCRALEFLMAFIGSHPEARAAFQADYKFINRASRYGELITYLAVSPDTFDDDQVVSFFARLTADDFRSAWAEERQAA